MPRRSRIKILTPDGFYFCSRSEGARLLANSEADIVSVQPPVLRLIITPNYHEERRFLSGVVTRGATKGQTSGGRALPFTDTTVRAGFNGVYAKPKLYRARPPRNRWSPEYLELRRLATEALIKRGA